MIEEVEQQRIRVRRRIRGTATTFIVVSLIGAAAVLFLSFTDQAVLSIDVLWGQAIMALGLFGAGMGAWHGSRIAAIAAIALLIAQPVSAFMGLGSMTPGTWVRSAAFLILAIFMTVSAFQYRALSRAAEAAFGGLSLVRWPAKIVAWLVVAIVGLGLYALAFGTSSIVQRGSELSPEQVQWLHSNGFLIGNEEPLFMYLDGAFDMETGGSLLTDQYAGAWWAEDGAISSTWIELGHICEVKTVSEGSVFEDAVYSIHTPGDESWVELWLSIEGDMHKRFISRMKALNARKMRPEVQAFCDD